MSPESLAESPALQNITNSFVNKLLAGSASTNEIVAGVVAGVYFLLLLLSAANLFIDKCRPHLLLIAFCSFRVVCFSVRAYMQKHLTSTLAIVYETFFAIGFVALVKLLTSLLTTWTRPAGVKPRRGRFSLGLLQNHGTFQENFISACLIAGVVLAIVGATDAYDGAATLEQYNKGLDLLKAGYLIYLVAIGTYDILVITGPLLARFNYGRPTNIRSATMLVLALEVCGLLLTCKAVFQVVAVFTNPSLTFNNKFFWPLEVAPEILALCILCFPGFIRTILKGSHAYPEYDQPSSVTGQKHANGAAQDEAADAEFA